MKPDDLIGALGVARVTMKSTDAPITSTTKTARLYPPRRRDQGRQTMPLKEEDCHERNISLLLPYPPSLNTSTGEDGSQYYITSDKGHEIPKDVQQIIRQLKLDIFIQITTPASSNRRRSRLPPPRPPTTSRKVLLDSLSTPDLRKTTSNSDDIRVIRGVKVPVEGLGIKITELENA